MWRLLERQASRNGTSDPSGWMPVAARGPRTFPKNALPFTYGRKLGCHAQKVLLVLVARGEAGSEKNGWRFFYTVY